MIKIVGNFQKISIINWQLLTDQNELPIDSKAKKSLNGNIHLHLPMTGKKRSGLREGKNSIAKF